MEANISDTIGFQLKALDNKTNQSYAINEYDMEMFYHSESNDYLSSMSSLKVFFYCLYCLIFLLGIAGNALVCYVVIRNPTMHTVTNVFITNLALSDILLCVLSVPFTPLYLLTYKAWVFGSLLCHLVPYAQGLCLRIEY
jgi:hypothetical protein